MESQGLSASDYFMQKRNAVIQDIARLGNLSAAPSLCMLLYNATLPEIINIFFQALSKSYGLKPSDLSV